MKHKTRLLIDRITEKEPVPEVKAGNGKQQKQYRVLSVESKSAESEATTRQLTTDHPVLTMRLAFPVQSGSWRKRSEIGPPGSA